jgi:hypothetical protein
MVRMLEIWPAKAVPLKSRLPLSEGDALAMERDALVGSVPKDSALAGTGALTSRGDHTLGVCNCNSQEVFGFEEMRR